MGAPPGVVDVPVDFLLVAPVGGLQHQDPLLESRLVSSGLRGRGRRPFGISSEKGPRSSSSSQPFYVEMLTSD
jgi:hypothetical protein